MSIIREKNNNYVITNDNFKKMVLILYRIIANVPVIIMGDTGCGKTSLIKVLNQIINGGEFKCERIEIENGVKLKKEVKALKIININPAIDDEKICKEMDEADKDAEELKKNKKELWLFFDEMNTCSNLSLLTEIFINREYNGKNINDNIRLIGACNPYRRRKDNIQKWGLSLTNDNDNDLVYLVQPFPQSLLYYVFSFGSIDDNDEKKYIYSILDKSFSKEENDLHEITTDAISECHIYLRKIYDPSVVSLREIARFSKCIEFFKDYFKIKNESIGIENNEMNNKLRSIN
jgi:energy-coupling factor transporter ATP-binding protein EcfA2